jgi:hypothetical protein
MYFREKNKESPGKKSPEESDLDDFVLDEEALEMLGDLALDEDIEDDVQAKDINRGIVNDKGM